MTNPVIYLHVTCRVCRGELIEILSLGNLRLNAFPKHLYEIEQIQRVPLVLMVCKGCGLVQLDRTVPQDWMYRHYWYRSSVNESMVAELQQVVEEAVSLVPVGGGETVLDIGANDGTLLSMYQKIGRSPKRIAVEPALNLQDQLRPHANEISTAYFPTSGCIVGEYDGQVSIVTAVAMMYDLEDPVKAFQAIHDLLAPGGVVVVQFQDFGQQIECAAFDTVCHEHLEYYTLWSLTHLFKQTGLMVQRVVHSPINGGSLRLFLRRQEDAMWPEPSVAQQLLKEAQQGLDTPGIREGNLSAFTTFKRRVERAKTQIAAAIEIALEQGCTIDIVGASTKGNILLQVLDIGPQEVRQAIDRDATKTGYLTITSIPIVGEDQGKVAPAGLWLVPAWQFRESILRRQAWYLEQGGGILFPLPHCEIVRQSWKQ